MATFPRDRPKSGDLGTNPEVEQCEVRSRIVRDRANDPTETQYQDADKDDANEVDLRRARQRLKGRQDLGILVRDLHPRAPSQAAGR